MSRAYLVTMRCVFVLITMIVSFSADARPTIRFPAPPERFLRKQFQTVNGKRMAYVEVGSGDPIVFLHGNPTSSYLWRNIMPELEGLGRLIAPDLIGMGDSDKLDRSGPNVYTYLNHSIFLFELLEQLGVKERVSLVVHDWGAALGFLWAFNNRFNPNSVKGIALMESIVAPFDTLEQATGDESELFRQLRSPAGESLVLEDNVFVEQVLPSAIIRNLTQAEHDEYRRPFLNPGEDRRPTLTWARELPIDGVPPDVVALVDEYSQWLGTSRIPKLFINGNPGLILVGKLRELVRTWPELTEVTVEGVHYVQEDSPIEIGQAIAEWLPR